MDVRAMSAASTQRITFDPVVLSIALSMRPPLARDRLGVARLAGLVVGCLSGVLGLVVEGCQELRSALVDGLLEGGGHDLHDVLDLLAGLVDDEALALREQGDGQVIVAGRAEDPICFSASDLSLLDAVCSFANGFASTSALSEFSHGERGWRETEVGGIISYEYAAHLLWAS